MTINVLKRIEAKLYAFFHPSPDAIRSCISIDELPAILETGISLSFAAGDDMTNIEQQLPPVSSNGSLTIYQAASGLYAHCSASVYPMPLPAPTRRHGHPSASRSLSRKS